MSSGSFTKIFVGNLSFKTRGQDLAGEFSAVGKVIDANIITRGNRSLGYGFVDMDTEENAIKAVSVMNKKNVDGRDINVELARPRDEAKIAERRQKQQEQRQKRREQGPGEKKEGGEQKLEGAAPGAGGAGGAGRGRGGGDRGSRRNNKPRNPRPQRNSGKEGEKKEGEQKEGDNANSPKPARPPRQQRRPRTSERDGEKREGGEQKEVGTGERRPPRERKPRIPREGGENNNNNNNNYNNNNKEGGERNFQRRPRRRNTSRLEGGTPSTNSLFVANLPFAIDNQSLEEAFSAFHVKSAKVIMNKFGRSKGFGFVELTTEKDQQAALEGMHEKPLQGRNIAVKIAIILKPREDEHAASSSSSSSSSAPASPASEKPAEKETAQESPKTETK